MFGDPGIALVMCLEVSNVGDDIQAVLQGWAELCNYSIFPQGDV